jgi:type II secretory pathway pseudopilin PulG
VSKWLRLSGLEIGETPPVSSLSVRGPQMRITRQHNGFSLMEVLVVISSTALLMGLLTPSLQRVRLSARRTLCLNNLRQMATAAQVYCDQYDGHYPIACCTERVDAIRYYVAWDYTTWKEWKGTEATTRVRTGLLWHGLSVDKIQQCPAYKGPANWFEDPYTGYNYNTSYIGCNETVLPVNSAQVTEVRSPSQTALFGDGEYTEGANKFMRAPFSNPRDVRLSDSSRYAGVQGFRHLQTTCISFCDGHAGSQRELYTETDPASRDILEEYNRTHESRVGFLSPDNRLYDLN